jgi:hypothetical protein
LTSFSSTFTDIPSKLQKLIMMPHPYLETFKNKGIYEEIILYILTYYDIDISIR